jgi:hypothetical protein
MKKNRCRSSFVDNIAFFSDLSLVPSEHTNIAHLYHRLREILEEFRIKSIGMLQDVSSGKAVCQKGPVRVEGGSYLSHVFVVTGIECLVTARVHLNECLGISWAALRSQFGDVVPVQEGIDIVQVVFASEIV